MRSDPIDIIACYIKLLPEFLAVVVFISMCGLWAMLASDRIMRDRINSSQTQMVKR